MVWRGDFDNNGFSVHQEAAFGILLEKPRYRSCNLIRRRKGNNIGYPVVSWKLEVQSHILVTESGLRSWK